MRRGDPPGQAGRDGLCRGPDPNTTLVFQETSHIQTYHGLSGFQMREETLSRRQQNVIAVVVTEAQGIQEGGVTRRAAETAPDVDMVADGGEITGL